MRDRIEAVEGPGEGVRVGEPVGEAETRVGRGRGWGEGAQ